MTVKVSPKTEYSKILVLYVDGEPIREVHRTVFGKHPKFPKDLTDEKFFEIEYAAAKRYSYWRLSKNNQPSTELKRALQDRLVSEDTVSRVIQEFIQSGYLDDGQYVTSFVRRNLDRGRGPKEIEMKLRQKKIPLDLIEECLQVFDDKDQRKEKILKIIEQKSRNKDLSDFKEKQKVVSALVRRGFALSEVLELLEESCS